MHLVHLMLLAYILYIISILFIVIPAEAGIQYYKEASF